MTRPTTLKGMHEDDEVGVSNARRFTISREENV
jgi:hypothetical protein